MRAGKQLLTVCYERGMSLAHYLQLHSEQAVLKAARWPIRTNTQLELFLNLPRSVNVTGHFWTTACGEIK